MLTKSARDDHRWYPLDPGLYLLRSQDPIKAGFSDEMAQQGPYPRCIPYWVLRLCVVLPSKHLSLLVSLMTEFYVLHLADVRSYVVVTESWNYRGLTYFAATHSISITVFGIVAGIIMWGTKRFKVSIEPDNIRDTSSSSFSTCS